MIPYRQTVRVTGFFLPLLACIAAVVGATEPPAPPMRQAAPQEVSWQLTNAKVVRSGQSSETGEGTLNSGYTVEADAVAVGEDVPVPQGKFRLILTAISPHRDTPDQKGGRWYLQGSWTLAGSPSVKTRHVPAVIRGDLTADLSFNPATAQGELDARMTAPRLTPPSRWVSGEGVFTGNERFEGKLTLTLHPRQATVQKKGTEP
ncbi:hypothetical protein [Geobacter pickeringii]|uniref:Lipid/polyisoprenoid-binding YceI-like domain-containing protein n=1 Tax=Geobacter pickeringii TaxID=345632 RepID=A0A0B5B826_9BACT|nr:hypothetical protein [Geobacter pickeringii]AJE02768.1 hypothetical protein GPICK_04750 [Geobacter pickeringii]